MRSNRTVRHWVLLRISQATTSRTLIVPPAAHGRRRGIAHSAEHEYRSASSLTSRGSARAGRGGGGLRSSPLRRAACCRPARGRKCALFWRQVDRAGCIAEERETLYAYPEVVRLALDDDPPPAEHGHPLRSGHVGELLDLLGHGGEGAGDGAGGGAYGAEPAGLALAGEGRGALGGLHLLLELGDGRVLRARVRVGVCERCGVRFGAGR